MSDARPVPKVAAAGVSGAVATLILWILALAGVDVPVAVAGALATACAFAAGYLKTG
jgi:hypothetical protein